MKFNKKLLALTLALILALPTGMLVSAEEVLAEKTEVVTELPLSSMEFQALYSMGMIGDDIAALKQNHSITRAQFLGSLYNVAGYSSAGYSALENPFIDVNAKTMYKDEISYFYSMGIVNGTSANTFSPDAPITYPQAAKIILDVCGFKDFVTAKYGNSLEGYVAMAMYINLSKGITSINLDSPLTADQAVKLLYNAGRTKVMEANGYTTDGDTFYDSYRSQELFAVRNNLYYSEGILQSNGLVSLVSNTAEREYALIDGNEYLLGGLDLTYTIGCKVDFFYKNERGVKTLAWVGESKYNSSLIVTADELLPDDGAYSMKNIVYRRNKKTFNAKINPHADIIYNNGRCNNAGLDKLKPAMGSIRLIDYDNDSIYDTVIVEEFTNIIVEGMVNAIELISGKYGTSVYLDDYEKVVIYRDGVEVSMTEMQTETSLSAIIDEKKELLILHINGPWMQHKLVSKYEEDGNIFYEFENGTFQVARNYADLDPQEYYKPEMFVGGTYKYYLDRNGRIADIEMISDGKLEYALLINAAPRATLHSSDDAEVKMLLLNGNIVVAPTKDKFMLNGDKGKNGADLLNYSGLYTTSGAVKEQVVQVALDSDGMIKEFWFAKDNRDHEYGYDAANFTMDYVGSHGKVSLGSVPWWGKFHMAAHIKIFVKYTGLNVEDPYGVSDGGRVPSTTLNMELYDIDRNMRPTVAYATMAASSAASSQALVSKIYHKRRNGETKKYLGVYYGGTYQEFSEFQPGAIPAEIKRGDVVTLSLYNNEITSVSRFLSLADKPEPYATGTYPSSIRFFGYIYGITTSGVTVIKPDDYSTSYGKILPLPLFNNAVLPVTLYDVRNDIITRGSWDDLCPSTTPNVDGSLPVDEFTTMACIQTTEHKVYDIIVVKY